MIERSITYRSQFIRMIILLGGIIMLSAGFPLLRFTWPGSNFIGGFLLTTGIQIFLWSIGVKLEMLSNVPMGAENSIEFYEEDAGKMDELRSLLQSATDTIRNDINTVLDKALRPRTLVLENTDKVLTATADVIHGAITESSRHQFTIFVGAPSFPPELESGQQEDEFRTTPFTDYMSSLVRLHMNGIKTTLYISLLTKEDFSKKPPATKDKYLKWLQQQIKQLERNPNYVLFDCPSAPAWGDNRSSILSYTAFLDIIGEASSCILIKDEEAARIIKENFLKTFDSLPYPRAYNVEELRVLYTALSETN